MMPRTVTTSPEMNQFRLELLFLFKKFSGELPADQCLAIAAHTVGQIIAFQDQRTMSSARAMQIVSANIELGNAEAIAGVAAAEGTVQ